MSLIVTTSPPAPLYLTIPWPPFKADHILSFNHDIRPISHMEGGDQLASLVNALHTLRLVTVRGFLPVCCVSQELICGPSARCLKVGPAIGKRI